jgi:2-dehydropantoate 2-reductase
VPDVVREKLPLFDFVVVTTKNIPEVSPSVEEVVTPAVVNEKTVIVLLQNGLNIEKPMIRRFPLNPILSSVSYISATQLSHGKILHTDPDFQRIGPFSSSLVSPEVAEDATRRYLTVYNPHNTLNVVFDDNVSRTRWSKLVYNASYNSVAAILRMDTARMRMSQHIIDDLIRPIMLEVMAAANACGITDLPKDLPDRAIRADSTETGFRPSMCQDADNGNLMEIEYIVGEPLREGQSRGVQMPTLKTIYYILKGLQLHAKEARGMWEPKFCSNNPYK